MNVPQKRHQQALLLRLSRSLSLSLDRPVPTFPMQIHMCTHTHIHDTDRLSHSTLSLCSRSSVLVRLSLSWTYLLFCSSVGFHVAPFVKTNLNLLYAQTCVYVWLYRVLLVYFLILLNSCYLCMWINSVTFLRVIGVWADHNISIQTYEYTNISRVSFIDNLHKLWRERKKKSLECALSRLWQKKTKPASSVFGS